MTYNIMQQNNKKKAGAAQWQLRQQQPFLFADFVPYFLEALDDEIDVFFCMACTYLGADSCSSLGNNRIGEGHNINALFHHLLCVFHSKSLIVQHDRYAGMGARDDIEVVLNQLCAVVSSNFLQMVTESSAFFQHVEHFDAGACNGGSQGVGE